MKVPNMIVSNISMFLSLSRLQNEGSQPTVRDSVAVDKSIKATE